MGQLSRAVWRHAAAGVHVRVDLRRQPHRRLQHRIQLQPQLRQERQIRPEPGQHDDLIRRRQTPAVLGHQHQAVVGLLDPIHPKPGDQLGNAVLDHLPGPLPERAPLR